MPSTAKYQKIFKDLLSKLQNINKNYVIIGITYMSLSTALNKAKSVIDSKEAQSISNTQNSKTFDPFTKVLNRHNIYYKPSTGIFAHNNRNANKKIKELLSSGYSYLHLVKSDSGKTLDAHTITKQDVQNVLNDFMYTLNRAIQQTNLQTMNKNNANTAQQAKQNLSKFKKISNRLNEKHVNILKLNKMIMSSVAINSSTDLQNALSKIYILASMMTKQGFITKMNNTFTANHLSYKDTDVQGVIINAFQQAKKKNTADFLKEFNLYHEILPDTDGDVQPRPKSKPKESKSNSKSTEPDSQSQKNKRQAKIDDVQKLLRQALVSGANSAKAKSAGATSNHKKSSASTSTKSVANTPTESNSLLGQTIKAQIKQQTADKHDKNAKYVLVVSYYGKLENNDITPSSPVFLAVKHNPNTAHKINMASASFADLVANPQYQFSDSDAQAKSKLIKALTIVDRPTPLTINDFKKLYEVIKNSTKE